MGKRVKVYSHWGVSEKSVTVISRERDLTRCKMDKGEENTLFYDRKSE